MSSRMNRTSVCVTARPRYRSSVSMPGTIAEAKVERKRGVCRLQSTRHAALRTLIGTTRCARPPGSRCAGVDVGFGADWGVDGFDDCVGGDSVYTCRWAPDVAFDASTLAQPRATETCPIAARLTGYWGILMLSHLSRAMSRRTKVPWRHIRTLLPKHVRSPPPGQASLPEGHDG